MSSRFFYRIAAVALFISAIGNTTGVLGTGNLTPEALALRQSMGSLHFLFMGADSSWLGFYVGFGLYLTLYLIFSAFLSWQLGGLSKLCPVEIRFLAWAFAICQAATVILSWKFFFLVPTVLYGFITTCLALGALKLNDKKS